MMIAPYLPRLYYGAPMLYSISCGLSLRLEASLNLSIYLPCQDSVPTFLLLSEELVCVTSVSNSEIMVACIGRGIKLKINLVLTSSSSEIFLLLPLLQHICKDGEQWYNGHVSCNKNLTEARCNNWECLVLFLMIFSLLLLDFPGLRWKCPL